jgi:hypothetical protein
VTETIRQFNDLTELVNYHLDLHKDAELRDLYKLVHQSVFGPEHLGEGASENAIAEEMKGAEDVGFEEPLLEPISIDAGACRVNLSTAREQSIPASLLAEAMRSSAPIFAGDQSEFALRWRELGDCLEQLARKFDIQDYRKLTSAMAEKEFPPLHHSGPYREQNRPAYRVLKRDQLERLMRGWRANCQ